MNLQRQSGKKEKKKEMVQYSQINPQVSIEVL